MHEMVENFVFHMIYIAVANSYILFQLHRVEHPEQEDLKRPKKYSITEFREELVRQLAGLVEYGKPPVFYPSAKSPGDYETVIFLSSQKQRKTARCAMQQQSRS